MKQFSFDYLANFALKVAAVATSARLMQANLPGPPERLARVEIGWQQDLPRPGTVDDDAFCPVGSGPGDRAGGSGRRSGQ